MATSSSTTFNLTAYEIVEEILDLIGALAEGETPSASAYAKVLRVVNLLTTSWQSQSIGLWLEQEATLYLEEDARSYSLGLTGGHCSADVIEDTLSAAAASGATSVSVTSTTRLKDGSFIGVELDDGELDWHQLNGNYTGTISFDLADSSDPDGVCKSQTQDPAGDLDIDGDLALAGVAAIILAARIAVISDGDDSAATFTIVGTDVNDAYLSEDLTGPSSGVAITSGAFKTVSQVAIDTATSNNITVGPAGGICSYQTPSVAGTLTMNGRLVSGGIVTFDVPRKVSITSDGNDSLLTFIVRGTDANDNFLYESIAGPNATTVNGSACFKTITSISVSGTGTGNITVGLAAGTLAGAAAGGNAVFSYQTKIDRPLEVLEARYVDSDDNEISIELLSWSEYQGLVDKDDAGSVLKACYRPLLDNGKFYTWPVCDDVSAKIKMTNKIPIDNLVSQPDTVHFPAQWLDAIIWNAAVDLAPRYKKTLSAWFISEAKRKKAHAMLGDSPRTPIQFTPYMGR